ncbi:hypothetical protein Z043_106330 [Scleropages formosus]|uniref:Reticulon n=1 Tax=Scleropages formosus TaxID=113540 RepID=A0A0P7VLL7_SCLFO|nr:hypothetical protein Z043_106330 [Scleropages formosus]
MPCVPPWPGPPAVLDLIYWRDMERTGVVFTGLVVGLLSLFQLSIVTVVSTLSLAVVCCTVIVRVYYHVLHALQWGDGVHPFKWYLDYDISLSGEKAEHHMQRIIVLTVSAIAEMKRILFVGNLIDSLKYLVLAYLLTFVGAIFNGLTLLIIGKIPFARRSRALVSYRPPSFTWTLPSCSIPALYTTSSLYS